MTNAFYRPQTKETALARVFEEMGEVMQIWGKAQRFGWENHHPDNPTLKNYMLFDGELNDLEEAIQHFRSFD